MCYLLLLLLFSMHTSFLTYIHFLPPTDLWLIESQANTQSSKLFKLNQAFCFKASVKNVLLLSRILYIKFLQGNQVKFACSWFNASNNFGINCRHAKTISGIPFLGKFKGRKGIYYSNTKCRDRALSKWFKLLF